VALVVPLIVAGAVVGASYGSAHLGARAVYRQWIEQSVVLKGRVKEDPSRTASGSVSLQLDGVVINGVSTPGTVYVSIRGSTLPKRGDILTIRGTIREGFGSFAASLTAMGVVATERPIPGDIGRVIRDWFAEQVREKIPEPQASLGIGFLTGQKSALPDDLSDALKIAGLTHIVVASGYNLTILVRMARKLLLNVSKFLSTVSAVGMIVFFVAITGLSPSMTRAGLVSSMSLMAWYYGRAFHPFVLLPLAAAITVIMQPSYVWGDLGWQLSFAAFAGVMIVAPLVQRYFFGEKEPGVFRQVFGETIAAHLVTVPIIALSFGTISHVAIIANLLVVPLVPLAMLLTFIVGILAIANVPLSMLIAEPASWLLGYMVTVARFVSELEWAQSELTIPSWWWIVYVALIGGMCVWIWKVTRFRFGATEPLY
jgi:competence protein ComEC